MLACVDDEHSARIRAHHEPLIVLREHDRRDGGWEVTITLDMALRNYEATVSVLLLVLTSICLLLLLLRGTCGRARAAAAAVRRRRP